MAGTKFDTIMEAIGEFRADIKNLKDRAEGDRGVRTREHEQNQKAIGDLRDSQQSAMSELRRAAVDRWDGTTAALSSLEVAVREQAAKLGSVEVAVKEQGEKLDEHARAVAAIKPDIEAIKPDIKALKKSRSRLMALAAVGLLVVSFIWGAIQIGFTQASAWAFKKFGG